MFTAHLAPRGPLYVGSFLSIDRELALEHIPSDTLFSAIVVTWAAQGALDARLAACLALPPPLRMTSAFPRIGETRLYPMPLGLKLNTAPDAIAGKARKRVRWVSEGVFQRLLAFGDLSKEVDVEGNFGQNGSVWLLQSEMMVARALLGNQQGELSFWSIRTVPRVSIGRDDNAPNYFETGRLMFAESCGLWFAASGVSGKDGARGDSEKWVTEALQQLQDSGLGGLRSTGHGAFTMSIPTRPPPFAGPATKPSGYAVLLSRYTPRDAEETSAALRRSGSAYGFDMTGGWCVDDAGTPWRRRPVRFVREGSLIGAGASGRVLDVMPQGVMNRPVYRSGLAFAVPVDPKAVLS